MAEIVIGLRVSAADLRRVRFAVSPLRETVMSLRALATAGRQAHLHRPWRAAIDRDLRQLPDTTQSVVRGPASQLIQ